MNSLVVLKSRVLACGRSLLAATSPFDRHFATARSANMPSEATNNATGLSAEESRKLERRQARSDESEIVRCVTEVHLTTIQHRVFAHDPCPALLFKAYRGVIRHVCRECNFSRSGRTCLPGLGA